MFRSVGAAIFGIASDRYGRKWPFIANNVLFIVLELVSLPLCLSLDRVNAPRKTQPCVPVASI